MSVAVRHDFDYASAVRQGSRIRVATKYTRIAREHFADKGVHVDLIKLYGSMELAPLTGLADAIVDLVSTGQHVEGQPAGGGRAHHGHLRAPDRQPGGAEAEARADPGPDRRLRPGGGGMIAPGRPARDDRRAQPEAAPAGRVNLRHLDTSAAGFEADFQRLRHWSAETDAAIEQRVAAILADVRARGDAAVLEYTARFDGVPATAMAELEIGAAELRAALDAASRRPSGTRWKRPPGACADYHRRQLEACGRSWQYRDTDGSLLGQKVTPLDRVGIYVPGGKAAYPSSVLMNAIPAQVAGSARS
jgi:hypothetical protein